MPVRTKLTYTDLESLPEDGKRYELHEGEVFVTAAPRLDHQEFAGELFVRLRDFVRRRKLGNVYQAVDVYFAEDTTYTPDLAFVSAGKADRKLRRFIRGAPDLIVEIVSPTTEVRDRGIKFQDYARYGVPEYWIADAISRSAEVYVLRGNRYELSGHFGEHDILRSELLPELRIPLAEVWPEPLPE